ncbi:SDR family oxidoreductase [Polyangium aurulentum]|uniref:SDR family oxidoreductase n=1 Tax=Polyangium aurulentum TaxID=2567896 RepID=UPI0010AE3C80|nr:SDR family oxidoreductase [Polyangium aurulentum]UQA58451.1 SDR family oxidoreductase [Polyangium aurulentum]
MARIAVVSGANRGIGLEVARELGRAGLYVVMGSRDAAAGDEARQKLAAEGLPVESRELDVAREESVRALVDEVRAAHGGVDVLVNNAGTSMDGFDERVARQTVDVNFYGAMRLADALLPLMRPGGRIVNVSSGLGQISGVSRELGAKFMKPDLGRDELIALVEAFVSDVVAGRHTAEGWPSSAYRVSKIAMNALTRIQARELSADPRGILANAIDPGWVQTRMGGSSAPRTVEQGAETIVWAALLPAGGPTGGFFRDKAPAAW